MLKYNLLFFYYNYFLFSIHQIVKKPGIKTKFKSYYYYYYTSVVII